MKTFLKKTVHVWIVKWWLLLRFSTQESLDVYLLNLNRFW